MEKTFVGTGKMKFFLKLMVSALFLNALIACAYDIELKKGEQIMSNSEKELLLTMILDHSDLQQYLHPELEERVPLKIKSNDELGTDLSIEKFGKQIEFLTSIDSTSNDNTPFLDIIQFNIKDNQLIFKMIYAIEGVTAKGIIKKNINDWEIIDFEVVEN